MDMGMDHGQFYSHERNNSRSSVGWAMKKRIFSRSWCAFSLNLRTHDTDGSI